ncbi:uncharacterized protein LOC124137763 [Haliotis rufescens]|uniref:uncharacterized protein LOC124137763 n=1 Tax=Haliotis rufescens TaxID=6454 RepID=UPI00201F1AA7|nr:uncharacterized protein LOC124137763 [Haliotis rufescens]
MTAPSYNESSKSRGGVDGRSYTIPNDSVCVRTRICGENIDLTSLLKAVMEIKQMVSENMSFVVYKLDRLEMCKDAEIHHLKDAVSRAEDTNRILNEQLYAYRINEQKMRYEIKLLKNENKELGTKVTKCQSEVASVTNQFRKLDVMTEKMDLVLQKTSSSSASVSLNNIATQTPPETAQLSEKNFTPETPSVRHGVTRTSPSQDCPASDVGRCARTQKSTIADEPSRNDTRTFKFGSVENHHSHLVGNKLNIKTPNSDGEKNIKTEQYVLSRLKGPAGIDGVNAAVTRYAADRSVRVTHVRHIKTWRGRAGRQTYTVLIDVACDDSHKIQDKFWPDGVYCRLYIPEVEMTTRNGDRARDRDTK